MRIAQIFDTSKTDDIKHKIKQVFEEVKFKIILNLKRRLVFE
jgi:hypothetical protein